MREPTATREVAWLRSVGLIFRELLGTRAGEGDWSHMIAWRYWPGARNHTLDWPSRARYEIGRGSE